MSSHGVTDPSHLTVENLKKELIEHDVPLPKYPKKDALVDLYREHILSSVRKPAAGHRLQYSDDDELAENQIPQKSSFTMSKRRSVSTKARDDVISYSGINISSLSDPELVEQLQHYGADVGPVTDTTRGVYEKKLAKLMDGRTAQRQPHISPIKKKAEEPTRRHLAQYSDEDEEEQIEDDKEAEDEAEWKDDFRPSTNWREPYEKFGGNSYGETYTVRKEYATSSDSLDSGSTRPSGFDSAYARPSMQFAARPPLSSVGASGDAFSSRLSSGFTTTRRSNVFTTNEYSSSTPRTSSSILRDPLPSLSSSRFGTSHLQPSKVKPESKANKRRTCFWLLMFFLLLGILIFIIVVWNMEPAYRNNLLGMGA